MDRLGRLILFKTLIDGCGRVGGGACRRQRDKGDQHKSLQHLSLSNRPKFVTPFTCRATKPPLAPAHPTSLAADPEVRALLAQLNART